MPRRRATEIKFTNEELALLQAFEQSSKTATKAEIQARAQKILRDMKESAQKTTVQQTK